MGGGHEKAPARVQSRPGLDNRFASAAGNPKVTRKAGRKEAGTPYRITPIAGEPFRIVVSGRDKWALDRLRHAGGRGCTPITEPAPRWSAYVFNLRALGVPVETIHEPHEGDYPGHHARYVLRAAVAPDWKGGAA
jgi:hypothetical protein